MCAKGSIASGIPYFLQGRNHHIRTVVDSKDDVGDARGSQTFHLVQDHGPVPKFDQWFGKGQGLEKNLDQSLFTATGSRRDLPEAAAEFRTHRRE